MCGRFTLASLSTFLDAFPWVLPPPAVPAGAADDRFNVAPTQPVAAVLGGTEGPRVEFVRWGLVPSWASDAAVGNKMINARAETLGEKPAFRQLLAGRRCLVPADGFYEWKAGTGKSKTPYYVRLRTGQPFALAGLWDEWRDPATGVALRTCTIITAEPNAVVAPLHSRMAVILRPEHCQRWVCGGPPSTDELADLLLPYPGDGMEAYPVSTAVNSPRAAGRELARRVDPTPEAGPDQPLLF